MYDSLSFTNFTKLKRRAIDWTTGVAAVDRQDLVDAAHKINKVIIECRPCQRSNLVKFHVLLSDWPIVPSNSELHL